MKQILISVILSLALVGGVMAKPGGSGGGRGSFSSGGAHVSSAPGPSRGSFSSAPGPAPSVTPSGQRGSFSSAAPQRSQTTTTTTTTVNRNYSGRYVTGGGYYGGWGMGYHYNNGLMTGLIIGSMMHPYGTVMYTGPGAYYNNAVLYPNGQVVNQQGYLVGTYAGGQFNPVQNGPMVAQPAPADAQSQSAPPQPQVIYVEKPGPTAGEVFGYIAGVVLLVFLIVLLMEML